MVYELKDVLISVKDVSLRFGDKQILKPISLEVRDIVCPDIEERDKRTRQSCPGPTKLATLVL